MAESITLQTLEQSPAEAVIAPDQWLTAPWETYAQLISQPQYKIAQGYYYNGQMRLETMPTGADHSRDHAIILFTVNLFCTLTGIALNGLDNASYRKTGSAEAQPDISYYIGQRASLAPQGGIIDLDQNQPPDLVIEISKTSLSDDLGQKRLLYEDLNIPEYWVIDVQNARIVAFAITNNNGQSGSRRISQSKVLPGLSIDTLQEALRLSRSQDQSQVGQWLLQQFSSSH